MKKRPYLIIFLLLLCAALVLGACGKKKRAKEQKAQQPSAYAPAYTVDVVDAGANEEKKPYNTLEKADKKELQALGDELKSVVEACRELYAGADKGSAMNAVLSDADIYALVAHIGSLGHPAVDSLGKWDMEYPAPMEEFGRQVQLANDCEGTYYSVFPDGQIVLYHLSCEKGEWRLVTVTAVWEKDGSPRVSTTGQFDIYNVHYTDKGWLFYSRDFDSFDVSSQSNTSPYTAVRVKPQDATMKALCKKYVAPIGYFENNLFTTTWTQFNPGPIDFNSLFAYLFGMYNGTEMLSSYNIKNHFKSVNGTNLYLIPTDSFEEIVKQYFDIDSAVLRSISDYSSAAGGYFFLGYYREYYNVTPRTPEPEVVDYHYNSDGSVTMRVDAVNGWYGTDRAFSHELTVYEYESGRIKYISNTLLDAPENILPENKLCHLLDSEREKTAYKKQ